MNNNGTQQIEREREIACVDIHSKMTQLKAVEEKFHGKTTIIGWYKIYFAIHEVENNSINRIYSRINKSIIGIISFANTLLENTLCLEFYKDREQIIHKEKIYSIS